MTEMKKIREIARAFACLDIQSTQIPFHVQHPFTESGFSVRNVNGKMEVFDICESDENLAEWRSDTFKKIDSCERPYELFGFITKGFRFAFLKHTQTLLSKEDLGKILRFVWQSVEFPNFNPNFSLTSLVRLFKRAGIANLCTPEEMDFLEKTPDTITVYRGLQKKASVKALSWTLSRETAEWFAKRFSNDGKVYSATVRKADVLAYFACSESEVIVDPSRLENIKKIH